MRSGLQPVAILSNKDSYHNRFAPPVDARARSENASAVSNMAQEAGSMQENECRGVGVLQSWQRSAFGDNRFGGMCTPRPGREIRMLRTPGRNLCSLLPSTKEEGMG